jgi:transcriptional regulator
MYLPRHFREDDDATAIALARTGGFGHLIVAGPNGLASTPMPFLVDDVGALVRGHLARPNPIWQLAPSNALFIVPVSDAYISPTWYPSKAEHGRVVPTWNYEVVHFHGHLEAHDDVAWVAELVRDLTDLHEATMPNPWSVDDAPEDYVTGLQRGIVGVSLTVTRFEAKRKLSQNKTAEELAGATVGLAASGRRGASQVATAMGSGSRAAAPGSGSRDPASVIDLTRHPGRSED